MPSLFVIVRIAYCLCNTDIRECIFVFVFAGKSPRSNSRPGTQRRSATVLGDAHFVLAGSRRAGRKSQNQLLLASDVIEDTMVAAANSVTEIVILPCV